MAMVVEMEIGSVAVFSGLVLRLSCSAPDFSLRGGFLYLSAFTKVVLFDDTMAAATIRAQLYGRTKKVPPYSCSSNFLESFLEPRFLWVVWNLVYLTLML